VVVRISELFKSFVSLYQNPLFQSIKVCGLPLVSDDVHIDIQTLIIFLVNFSVLSSSFFSCFSWANCLCQIKWIHNPEKREDV
jgi:hypothetical protein